MTIQSHHKFTIFTERPCASHIKPNFWISKNIHAFGLAHTQQIGLIYLYGCIEEKRRAHEENQLKMFVWIATNCFL